MSIEISSLASLESPDQLQWAAHEHNWDDGLNLPQAIADHPSCDLAVALQLFWMAEAIVWYTGDVKPNEYNQEWVEFCSQITNRILSGHYKLGTGKFNPGLGRVQLYKYRKISVPEILISEVG